MPDAAADSGRRIVVTTMPLSDAALVDLNVMLGPDFLVVDIKHAPATASIVLTTTISSQLLGSLRAMFPGARILLTELEDAERGIRYDGPITRALGHGPDGYFVAHDLEALAPIVRSEARLQALGSRVQTVAALGGGAVSPPPEPVGPADHAGDGPGGEGSIVWVEGGSAAGECLDLAPVDAAVAALLGADVPRESRLWVTWVAEAGIFLARDRAAVVAVDVNDLPDRVRAELRIHVATEGVGQSGVGV